MTKGNGDFSIGSTTWPGLSKVVEECGEVLQLGGKLIGSHGERDHFDGSDLGERLVEELGDLAAAIQFFCEVNPEIDITAVRARAEKKLQRFHEWHREEPPKQPVSFVLGLAHMGKITIKDDRPANCRNRLRDEGKAYPKSGCAVCGSIIARKPLCEEGKGL